MDRKTRQDSPVSITSERMTYEYLLVSDTNSRILKPGYDRFEMIKLANIVRKSGGQVTIFKSTRM